MHKFYFFLALPLLPVNKLMFYHETETISCKSPQIWFFERFNPSLSYWNRTLQPLILWSHSLPCIGLSVFSATVIYKEIDSRKDDSILLVTFLTFFFVPFWQGRLVNEVWPLSRDSPDSKLDVIFFEGNVGRRKRLSCLDTWVQRGKPNVQWPREWLPKDLGVDIRVLVLEYAISDRGVEGVSDELQTFLLFR